MVRSQIKKTSADRTAIGFDYQYYFFLWKILSLRTGQKIGWEVKDDVHIETEERDYFYQVKHSVQKSSSGNAINLTTFDKDLWKTISNWLKVVTDKNDGRSSKKEQLKFIKKTTFILTSNKSSTEKNQFINNLVKFQDKRIDLSGINSIITDLLNKTKDDEISEYINSLKDTNDEIREPFLNKLQFELDKDDILAKCRYAIKADKVPKNKIDDTFRNIDSALREDNFITIKKGEKVLITFDTFYEKYRKYYDITRSSALTIKPFNGVLPDKLEEQTFIKQLVDIGDVQSDNLEEIANFTKFKLQIHNNLEELRQSGEITKEELMDFKSEAIIQWNNEFRPRYRGDVAEKSITGLALNILDEIRRKNLAICSQSLGTEVSNGFYYKLSDEPVIGWRSDWQERYKNEN